MKADGDKHKVREPYVVKCADKNLVTLVKLVHSNDPRKKTKLGSKDVEARQEDIYLAEVRRTPVRTLETRGIRYATVGRV